MNIREKLKYSIPSYLSWIDDKTYLRIKYFLKTHHILHLNHPKTFNEKIQWLKLYDRKPIYTTMVDKYTVKQYVADRIGEQYTIPTLGVWKSFDEIDFNKLPNQFVLKCTHDSGGLVICKDKSKFDIGSAKKKINNSLKRNYFYSGREWPYKNVPRKIIAEQYMEDESGFELKDYKIFNFNGEPQIIQVDFGRFIKHKRNLYTTDWNLIDVELLYDKDKNKIINKPVNLNIILQLSRRLSENISFVRTDFYVINDSIYFGELTFYPGAGFEEFEPQEWDYKLGQMIRLPEKTEKSVKN